MLLERFGFGLVEFGLVYLIGFDLVWFAYSTEKEKKNYLILIDLLREFIKQLLIFISFNL